MNTLRYGLSVTAIALFCTAASLAQTPTTPPSDTSPSAASSPAQRDSTKSPANETPTTAGSKPSDASTPAQRAAVEGKSQTMKECMDEQAAKHAEMSKSDMTKACNEQMKMQKAKR